MDARSNSVGGGRDALIQEQQRRFESSGKSVVAFCREEGVAVSTFYQRRSRLNKPDQFNQAGVSTRRAAFIDAGAVAISPATRAVAPSTGLLKTAPRVEVRIDLGDGLVLHVSRN